MILPFLKKNEKITLERDFQMANVTSLFSKHLILPHRCHCGRTLAAKQRHMEHRINQLLYQFAKLRDPVVVPFNRHLVKGTIVAKNPEEIQVDVRGQVYKFPVKMVHFCQNRPQAKSRMASELGFTRECCLREINSPNMWQFIDTDVNAYLRVGEYDPEVSIEEAWFVHHNGQQSFDWSMYDRELLKTAGYDLLEGPSGYVSFYQGTHFGLKVLESQDQPPEYLEED